MTRRHVVFRGRVQGVGFRWTAKETADSLGLAGWARNLRDGSVEAEVEGTPDALDAFERRMRTGCPSARVDEIVSAASAVKNEKSFRII